MVMEWKAAMLSLRVEKPPVETVVSPWQTASKGCIPHAHRLMAQRTVRLT